MKLFVFDFDSTLMDGETIDFLAGALGLKEKVAEITEMAMRGELDFFESLITRVKLLEGLEEKKVNEICHNLPFMPGAKETIEELKKLGYKVVVFSGGFRNATSHAKDVLELDADFSNILHAKNGRLTGLVGGDMMFDFSKGDMLQRLQKLLGVSQENTAVAGDGANDRSMFAYAKTKIAFCAKDILKKEANVVIEKKDLREILEYVS
ncbi:phosphoserine phosphatase [Nitratiruptor sp. YY08-26]|uniref:phosphoserine phosphatase SerB n=1 Tax=unclassified Nitratiruptor TaxID=2624044 RepID=UPI0019163E52|nr:MULTISPECIES: phosphoserine phosphatase SerB [unclassified Nitratiruptor]BCD62613.1 phosphoserine phosphatase [Nitratiruptor sp. YY08-13]BCD66549.1 phosphoserine phosphatase [Nitratiruptor sp. YY08-26]